MALSKSGTNIIASRYAAALIEAAVKTKSIEKVEKDVEELMAMYEDSDDLRALAVNPLVNKKQKSAAIGALAEKAKFQTLTVNFLRVIAENGRLDLIENIISALRKSLRERRGNVEAIVRSAYALSNAQTKALQKQLSNAMGSSVTLNVSVDKKLLGGMVVTVGSWMIDDSVRRKLDVLGRVMASGTN